MTAPHCVCQASALLCSALLTRPRVWCRAITSFVVGRPPYKSNFYCHPGRAGGTPMLLVGCHSSRLFRVTAVVTAAVLHDDAGQAPRAATAKRDQIGNAWGGP